MSTITKSRLQELLRESLIEGLSEIGGMREGTPLTFTSRWESGELTVHGIMKPGFRGSYYQPPESPEFVLVSLETEDGKELSPEQFVDLENRTRQEMGEDILTVDQFLDQVHQQASETDSSDEF